MNQNIASSCRRAFAGTRIEIQLQSRNGSVSTPIPIRFDAAALRVGDYKDPNTFLDCSDRGGNNRTGWSNARYDELIGAAAREAHVQRRFDIFREAERILVVDEAPICPLYYWVGIQLYDRSRLGGIEANLIDEHPFKNMFWKDRPPPGHVAGR